MHALADSVVFARGSGRGTQLARRIGAPAAALIYHRLLKRTVRHLQREGVHAAVAVPPDARECAALAERGGARVISRRPGTPGPAVEQLVRRARGPIVIVDSDAPRLDGTLVRAAARALSHYHLVLGPSWHGGFYLIGLRGPAYALGMFRNQRWGSSHLLVDTLKRAPRHWQVGLLPVLADANDPVVLAETVADHTSVTGRLRSAGRSPITLERSR